MPAQPTAHLNPQPNCTDIAETSKPTLPPSGVVRLYADSTTGLLACIDSTGANVIGSPSTLTPPVTVTASADNQTPLTVVGHSGTASVPVQIIRSDPSGGAYQLKLEDAASANNLALLFVGGEGGGTVLDATTDGGSTVSSLAMTSTTNTLTNGDGSSLAFDKTALAYTDGTGTVHIIPDASCTVATTFPREPGTLATRTAAVNLTAQAAAITATDLFVVGANGQGLFRVSFVAKVTTVAGASSVLGGANGFQIVYTDPDDSVAVTTPVSVYNSTTATLSLNTTQAVYSGSIIVNAKLSTHIQYVMGYTSVNGGGADMKYSLHITAEAI